MGVPAQLDDAVTDLRARAHPDNDLAPDAALLAARALGVGSSAAPARPPRPAQLLSLQGAVGNRAVRQFIASWTARRTGLLPPLAAEEPAEAAPS
ncbi:MAG TPA: hypothetical protein VME46_02160 [Acidimicrobiales bacterium]|nr:hypothetical protein [Acidimicrobiales bacterium]